MFGHDKDHGYATAMSIGNRILFNGGTEYDNNEDYKSKSTRFTNDGQKFAELPPMPYSLTSHCMVALDSDDLFVTGGGLIEDDYKADNDKSFLYHSDKMEWEELPGLLTPRTRPLCGMVHNANGDQEVIAAGGSGEGWGPRGLFAIQKAIFLYVKCYIFSTVRSETKYAFSRVVEIYNVQSKEWRPGL